MATLAECNALLSATKDQLDRLEQMADDTIAKIDQRLQTAAIHLPAALTKQLELRAQASGSTLREIAIYALNEYVGINNG